MKFDEILEKYYNEDREEHERKIGRYWASDVYAMLKGYLKPEDFFKKKPIDLKGAGMIATGEAFEDKLKQIFDTVGIDYDYQAKKEIQIDEEIVLVVKPDFVFKHAVLETKFPFRSFPMNSDGIPERYLYQLECEYRAFYLPVYLGVFTIPFYLKTIEFVPSKRRWNKIKNTIRDFHQKLCTINKNLQK